MIKKIGNEKTYVEFETVMTFGTKLRHKKIAGNFNFTLNEGETGQMTMSMKDVPFEKTAECFLLCKQVKKIVENGVEIYLGKEELKAEVLERVVYNTENLYQVIDELTLGNGLREKKVEAEEKKD